MPFWVVAVPFLKNGLVCHIIFSLLFQAFCGYIFHFKTLDSFVAGTFLRVYSASHPVVAGIGSCTYCELDKDTGKRMDGWRSDVFSKVFLYLFIYLHNTYIYLGIIKVFGLFDQYIFQTKKFFKLKHMNNTFRFA